jgi:hypothetical protein
VRQWLDSWPRHSASSFGILIVGISFMFWGQLAADILGLVLIFGSGGAWTYVCRQQSRDALGKDNRRASQWMLASAASVSGIALAFAAAETLIHRNPEYKWGQPHQVSMSCERYLLPKEGSDAGLHLLPLRSDAGFTTSWGTPPWSLDGPPMGYRCRLRNYAASPLFNIAIILRATFKEIVTKPADQKPSEFTGIITSPGKVSLTRDWEITVPELALGSEGEYSFYVYNDSNLYVSIDLPKTVTIGGTEAALTRAPGAHSLWFPPDFKRFPPRASAKAPPSQHPRLAQLYYGERVLNESRIRLQRGCDEPPTCLKMHAWPKEHPGSFALYGVWMNRQEVPSGTNGTMSFEFSSRDVKPREENSGQCKSGFEMPHDRYRTRWECGAAAEDGGERRVFFRFFSFTPKLTSPMMVRMRFRHGDVDSDVAEFTLLPPND